MQPSAAASFPSIHFSRGGWLYSFSVLAVMSAMGCASSLTTLQPARTVPAGHVQAVTSVSVTPPIGLAEDTWDALHELADGAEISSASDAEEMAELATMALVQPPSLDARFALGIGLAKRLEIGGRVSGSMAGGGFRLQWLRRRPGIYGAIGANVDYAFNAFPLERITDRVDVQRFRRIDYSVPLTLGYSRKRFHFWAGPKLVISTFDARVGVCLDSNDGCGQQAVLRARGRARYYAGQVGLAFGSERFWIAVEMTIARARIEADLEMDMPRRDTMSARSVFEGRVVTPAIGLMLWI